MKTYLLTWNPKSSPKDDDYLREEVADLLARRPSPRRWSAGNNQGIRKEDRVFLLKQGAKEPGLMGSGVVTEGSHLDQHRDPAKRRVGIQGWFIKLQWDRLVLPENVLPKPVLLERDLLPKNLIRVACSGPAIPEEYVARLEAAWAQFCSSDGDAKPPITGVGS